MRVAVIVFPGSNCDRDLAVAFRIAGADVTMVWHKDTKLPKGIDIVGLPGGFSFGDYLRCGAIAAHSPICRSVVAHADRGAYVLGVCNGFQILTETGLLPGALLRNIKLKFISKSVALQVRSTDSGFTCGYERDQILQIPIAHHDGKYTSGPEVMKQLQDEDRIAFKYVDNLNGSDGAVAGILSANRRILGMMPHPERAVDIQHQSPDGLRLFAGLLDQVATE